MTHRVFYGRFFAAMLALGLTACEPPGDGFKKFAVGISTLAEGLGKTPKGSTDDLIKQLYPNP